MAYSSPLPMLWCMYLCKVVFSFSLSIYPGVELLDHMVVLFLVFGGTSILFSIVAAPINILTNSVLGFPFLNILATFVICRLFDDSLLDRYEMIFHSGFDLHFSDG